MLIVPEAAPEAPPTRRALLISYFYPPHAAVGAHRAEGLARWLPEFGWQPTVLTADRPGTAPDVLATPDLGPALVCGVPDGTPRRALLQPLKRLARFLPRYHDEYARWSYGLVARAIEEGRARQIDLVWATCNPFSAAPAALAVARALGVPCVIDLRDALPAYLTHTAPALHWFYRAMRGVDAVTVSAPANVTSALAAALPRPPAVVLSGMWAPDPVPAQPSTHFTMLHAGSLYGFTRDLRPLLAAVARLAAEEPGFREAARVQMLGAGSDVVARTPGYAEVADLLEMRAHVPYAEVTPLMAQAGALVIVKGAGFEHEDALPAKFFDGLPFAAPIVAFGGVPGTLADLLAWSRAGAWHADADGIAAALRTAFRAWRETGVSVRPRLPEALAYLTQRRMAAECATVFNTTLGAPPATRSAAPWKETTHA
jgi:hypothetical protein